MEYSDQKQRQQFDIDHGVNTAGGLARMAYRKIQNLERGNAYQASWTSTVKTSFDCARDYLKDRFDRYTFVDVGCGKGKVNLIWQQELNHAGITQRNVGVDYYEPLLNIARNNWQIMFPRRPSEFYLGDAATYDFRRLGDRLIVYLFNPFSSTILLPFLRNLNNWPVLLIYNVPTGDVIVRGSGFNAIDTRVGPNQNETIYIYKNY